MLSVLLWDGLLMSLPFGLRDEDGLGEWVRPFVGRGILDMRCR